MALDLSYCGDDPGAAKYGNFINYYSFHTSKERMESLNPHMFPPDSKQEKVFCLDIGCNTGDLTKEVKKYIKSLYPESDVKMLAMDIDQTLIERADETNSDHDIKFVTGDVLTKNGNDLIEKYLGYHHVTTFDVIFCFSVSMWIHINNGDDGFVKFLEFLKKKGKTIIIEPQLWNSYKKAQRRMRKSGSTFNFMKNLKIRNDVDKFIENYLTDNTHIKICECQTSTWNRTVQSFVLKTLYNNCGKNIKKLIKK